jgi:hypothetical protein
MPKWVKLIIGLGLLPVCVGVAEALWLVLRAGAGGRGDLVWVPLLAGAACWLVVFLMLPKPIWLYVVGHELTHVVWTWAFGGRVKKFKAASSGGHVVVTKSNFLIALAPYFFPLYAALLVLVFLGGHLVFDWRQFMVWFHLLTGAAYAFHLTLTAHALRTSQTDITGQGYIFSAVVIFLGNALVLLVGVPLLSGQVAVLDSLGWVLECTGRVLRRLAQIG